MTDNDACIHSLSLPFRFLIEGPPKIGKMTVIDRLVSLLKEQHMPVGGFLTNGDNTGDEVPPRSWRHGL